MRFTIPLVTFVMAALLVLPAAAQPLAPVVADLEDALRSVDDAMAVIAHSKPSRARDRSIRHLENARFRLAQALDSLGHRGRPGPGANRDRDRADLQPAGLQPMDSVTFADLLNQMKELSFANDQLAYLRDASRRNRFLTSQVLQVVQLFDFDKDRVEAAAILYPRTLDRDNFYQVQKAMEFEQGREALRKRIRIIDRSEIPVETRP